MSWNQNWNVNNNNNDAGDRDDDNDDAGDRDDDDDDAGDRDVNDDDDAGDRDVDDDDDDLVKRNKLFLFFFYTFKIFLYLMTSPDIFKQLKKIQIFGAIFLFLFLYFTWSLVW